MFTNIGSKCKTAAKVLCYTGIALSVVTGLVLIILSALVRTGSAQLAVNGIIVLIFGCVGSWLGSLGLYAVGEAAENSAIAANLAVKADMERERQKKDM